MNVRTRQSNNGMWAEQQIWAICLLRFITISNITLSFDSLLFYNIGYSRFKHIKLTHLCKVAHVWNGDLPGWPDTSSLSRLQCRLPATSQKWQASLWEVERITRVRYRVKERERENKWLLTSDSLGAWNLFVVKNFELHVLYKMCYKFIIIITTLQTAVSWSTVNQWTDLKHLRGGGAL